MPIDSQLGKDGTLTITLKDLNKGLDSQSEPTETSPDRVPDLQNVTTDGGYPSGMPGSTLHLAGFVAPDNLAPQVLARYRPETGTEAYVMACQNGTAYGSTDGGATWTTLRHGFTGGAASWFSHTQIGNNLVIGNGTNENYRYDGTRLIRVGAKHIADMAVGEAVWAGGVADAVHYVQGTQGRKLTGTAGATDTMTLTPTTPWDMEAGLGAARDYADTDHLNFALYIDTAANLTLASSYIRFGDVAGANYFEAAATAWGALTNGWNVVSILRSAFAVGAGAPTWTSIARMTLLIDAEPAVNVNCTFDDVYVYYADVLPPCQILREFKGMLLGADGLNVYYSATGAIDQFDTVDTSVIVIPSSGGSAVTGMHEYGDYMLVTTDSSVHSLHVQFRNLLYPDYDFTRQEVTTEHGCTSHRSMVMAAGKVWMHWRNNLHAFAGIGTTKTSEFVDPTLADIEPTRLAYVVGGRLHDANQLYFWWTPAGGTQNTRGIAYNTVQQSFLPLVDTAVALAENVIETDVEYLLTPDYAGRVLDQNTGTTWDGDVITRFLTLPWLYAGRPNPVVSWRRMHVNYEYQASGTLIVEARTANHPSEFAAAPYSTIASLDMSVVGEWGGISLHRRAPWIQIRLRTVGAQFKLYWPIEVVGMPLWRRG